MTKSAFPDICFGSIWYKLLTFNTAVSIQRPCLWGAALSRRGARCHLEVIRYFHFRLSCFWECVLDSKNEYHCLTASGVFFLQSPPVSVLRNFLSALFWSSLPVSHHPWRRHYRTAKKKNWFQCFTGKQNFKNTQRLVMCLTARYVIPTPPQLVTLVWFLLVFLH